MHVAVPPWLRDALTWGVAVGLPLGLARATVDIAAEDWWSDGLYRLLAHQAAAQIADTAVLAVLVVAAVRLLADRETHPAARPPLIVALVAWPLVRAFAALEPVIRFADLEHRDSAMLGVLHGVAAQPGWVVVGLLALALADAWPHRGERRPPAPTLRLPWLAVAAGVAPLIGWTAARIDAATMTTRGPDVVLLVIDTLRADHLEPWGYARSTSPRLADLASDGITYASTMASAPWTTPSTFGIHTGWYPDRLGVVDVATQLPKRAVTLAERLRDAGYWTVGATANHYASGTTGLDSGFVVLDPDQARGHAHVSSDALTDRALELLDAGGGRPTFLYVHYFDPHFDYILHGRWDFDPGYAGPVRSGRDVQELQREARGWSARDISHLQALYDSEIAYTDQAVGRLLDGLRQRGRYRDALVVVVADHGEARAERDDRWVGHTRTVYEEQLHVPLLVKLPGNAAGGRIVAEPVSVVDVAPTIAAVTGYSLPDGLDGRALVAPSGEAIRPVAPHRVLFAETRRMAQLQAARKGRFKLIRDLQTGEEALFDLVADPGERSPLVDAGDAPLPELRAFLDARRSLAPEGDAQPARFMPDEREQLEALGYVDP